MLNNQELQKLKELDTSKLVWFLSDSLRGIGIGNSAAAYAIAYVVVKSAENEDSDMSSLNDFVNSISISDETTMFLSDSLKGLWDLVIRAKRAFDPDLYKAFILFNELNDTQLPSFSTPISITNLALELLDVEECDSVADFFTGTGSFIRESYLRNSQADYFGNEISLYSKSIATIRAEMLGDNVSICHQDVMTTDFNYKFDRIFADCPMGVKVNSFEYSETVNFFNQNIVGSKRLVSLFWMSNITIINTLKPNGKAVTLTNSSSLFKGDEKYIRKYFVDSGFISAIIALPAGMLEYTKIPVVIMVLSHKNNMGIRFVDAQHLCTKGRRYNTFSEQDIAEIINACELDENETSQISKFVTLEEIVSNDYNLDPKTYFEPEIEVADGVEFGTVISKITRGAQLKAAELDQLTTEEATDYQYLMLSHIKNGKISDELPYIKPIESNLIKYCIKDNSLIISKNGTPAKAAIASVPEGKTILATGNVYVIELDENKANPYFILSFLNSNIGKASLKAISVGAVIPNIPIEAIKKMCIPLPSMERQNEVANKYLAALDEIKVLQTKIAKAEASLSHIYDESGV